MNQKCNKKARKAYRLIAVLTIVTLLFGCMGCSKKTPREALEEAYEKTFVKNNPSESVLGISEIDSHINDNKAHSSGFSVTLQELSGKDISEFAGVLSGLGIRIDTASDLLNRKSAGTLDITYGGTKYLSLGGQLQGSKIYLTAPQLIDGSLTVDFSTLKEDLSSDSMIGQLFTMYGIELPEDLFSQLTQSLTTPASLADLGNVISAYDDLCDAIRVEEADKKTVSFSSDVSYKKAYKVTIPKHAYSTLITSVLQYANDTSADLSESLGSSEQEQLDILNLKLTIQQIADIIGDIVLNVGVTKDNYICCAESSINTGAESLLFTATFTGKDNPLNDTDVVVTAAAAGQTFEIVYAQDYDTDDNEASIDLRVKLNGITELMLSGAGKYKDVVKGQKYTFDYDHIDLNLGDELSLSLSGDVYVDTTKCDIPTPSSTEHNLFRMSEDDFYTLGEEIMTNLQEDPLLSKVLNALDLGM